MATENKDVKQPEENVEFVKEADNPKRNYIFQKDGITKSVFFIVVACLILIIIGIVVSGVFFESPTENPWFNHPYPLE